VRQCSWAAQRRAPQRSARRQAQQRWAAQARPQQVVCQARPELPTALALQQEALL